MSRFTLLPSIETSTFARSAAASLRRAIKTEWNPLAQGVGSLTKGVLTAWIKEHSSPRPVTAGAAEKRVVRMVERITELLEQLPQDEAARIRATAVADISTDTAPQRIVSARLTRQDRPRAAPH